MLENPFILEPYQSKAYFCDREKETEEIIRNITNGRNTTLISPRRLGKTGLIFRVFDEMMARKLPYETIYCDISDTLSLEEFIKVISDAVVSKLEKQQKITAFFKTLKSVRPLLGIDPLTGSPQVSFTFADDSQKQSTLKEVMDYLERYPQKVVLAIDEFQQIREYNDVNMEAVLRKHIQHLHNVRFIYCGSKKHTMTDMFTNAKKPFYESTSYPIFPSCLFRFIRLSSRRNSNRRERPSTMIPSALSSNGRKTILTIRNGCVMKCSPFPEMSSSGMI